MREFGATVEALVMALHNESAAVEARLNKRLMALNLKVERLGLQLRQGEAVSNGVKVGRVAAAVAAAAAATPARAAGRLSGGGRSPPGAAVSAEAKQALADDLADLMPESVTAERRGSRDAVAPPDPADMQALLGEVLNDLEEAEAPRGRRSPRKQRAGRPTAGEHRRGRAAWSESPP